MKEIITYKNILDTVKEEQNRFSARLVSFDSIEPATSKLMAEINAKIKRHSLVVVIFCNPNTPFAKNEILPSLNYLHKRSEQYINIFCCGFGISSSTEKYSDMKNIAAIDGESWFYSDEAFVNVVEEFENKTKWRFSGESELLVLDILKNNEVNDLSINNAIVCNLEQMQKDNAIVCNLEQMQKDNAIVCNLEQMQKDNAFTSVRSLMEKLIAYVKSDDAANAWEFSDKQGIQVAKTSLKDSIIELLPKGVQNLYTKAESYAVKQI